MGVCDDLHTAIAEMEISDESVPPGIEASWVEVARLCLAGWANEIERDAKRITSGIDVARAVGEVPSDDEIAALEEAFWRIRSATEKVDALIALAYGPTGLRPYDARHKSLRFDPDVDENARLLTGIGSDTAYGVRAARAAIEGERATLRRHQLIHSVVPIAALHFLAPYIVVRHRDGRVIPGGFELSHLTPERWSEGVSTTTPRDLFKRRLHEAERSAQKLAELLEALVRSLPVDACVEVPQKVYLDEDNRTIAFDLPAPRGPVPHFEIAFVVDGDPSVPARVISSERKVQVGEELTLDDELLRIVRVEDSDDERIDQIAHCRGIPRADF